MNTPTKTLALSLAVIAPMTLTGCVSVTRTPPQAPAQQVQSVQPSGGEEPEVVAVPVLVEAPVPVAVPTPTAAGHVVAPGDTLASIAAAYGWGTAEELAAVNGITDLNLIFPGQVIRPAAPTAAPEPERVVHAVAKVKPIQPAAGPSPAEVPEERPTLTVPVVSPEPERPKAESPKSDAPRPVPTAKPTAKPTPTPTPAPSTDPAEPVPAEPTEPAAPVEPPVVEAPAEPEIPVEVLPADTIQLELLVLVNDYRSSNGLPALSWDTPTAGAAAVWAASMRDAIMVTGPEGFTRNGVWAGRQVIGVNASAAAILASWQANTEDNALLLAPVATHVGAGFAELPAESTYGAQLIGVLNLGF